MTTAQLESLTIQAHFHNRPITHSYLKKALHAQR